MALRFRDLQLQSRIRNEAGPQEVCRVLQACKTQIRLSTDYDLTLKRHGEMIEDLMMITPRVSAPVLAQAVLLHDKHVPKQLADNFAAEIKNTAQHLRRKAANLKTGQKLTTVESNIIRHMNNKASTSLLARAKRLVTSPAQQSESAGSSPQKRKRADSFEPKSSSAGSSPQKRRKGSSCEPEGTPEPSSSVGSRVSLASIYGVSLAASLPVSSSIKELYDVGNDKSVGSPVIIESSPEPVAKDSNMPKKRFVEYLKGYCVVRRHADGSEETADMNQGPNGFALAFFKSTQETIVSELPNLALELYEQRQQKPESVMKKPAQASVQKAKVLKKPAAVDGQADEEVGEEAEEEEAEDDAPDDVVEAVPAESPRSSKPRKFFCTYATQQSYIQVSIGSQKKTLLIAVSAKQSERHRQCVERIHEAAQAWPTDLSVADLKHKAAQMRQRLI